MGAGCTNTTRKASRRKVSSAMKVEFSKMKTSSGSMVTHKGLITLEVSQSHSDSAAPNEKRRKRAEQGA